MVLTHRMISCMAPGTLLELLPHVLSLIIENLGKGDSDELQRDLDALVPLINQLIIRFKAALHGTLDPVIMQLLGLIMASVPEIAPGTNGATHVTANLLALQKHYFMVAHHVVSHDLTSVFISERNTPHLEHFLNTIIAGIVDVEDPTVKKICVSIMRELVRSWVVNGSTTSLNVNSFVDFVTVKVSSRVDQGSFLFLFPLATDHEYRDSLLHFISGVKWSRWYQRVLAR